MSYQLKAGSHEPFYGFATTVPAELHTPDIPISSAARSFYEDTACPDFEAMEHAWLNHPALPPAGSGSGPHRSARLASSAVQVAFDELGDHPSMTHWGINE